MIRRPPGSTLTATRLPYTWLVRSGSGPFPRWRRPPFAANRLAMIADVPSRLLLDGDALVANWRWLAAKSGQARCGAAIKADGYGLGAIEVCRRLAAAGCRDFFVATWRSEERRVGKACVSTGRSRWSPVH